MTRKRLLPIAVVLISVAFLAAVIALGRPPGPSAPLRGYSEFLDDVAKGKVTSVVQQDQILTVHEGAEVFSVFVPTYATDIYWDMQYAAIDADATLAPDIYSASAPPDNSWIGLLLTGVLPLVIIGGFILFMMRAARRVPSPYSLQSRLAQLDDARKAGQLTEEEYAAKRAELIRTH